MRLRRLDLLRYGKFTDRRIEFPSEGLDLHLVVGPNEAGKSTTRAALTELLFGVEKSTTYAFLHDYGNLRIGAELEQDRETLTVVRKKGNKNTLLDESDRPLPEHALNAYLGKVSRSVFERMFSLDHVSLVEGAQELLDAKDDVGRMLFQASGGLHRLGDLRRGLDSEADRLWAPRRSKDRAYFTALDQYQAATQELEARTVRVKDFRNAEEQVKSSQTMVEQCAVEQEELLRFCSRLERVRRVTPGLARRRKLRDDLLSLESAPLLPENAATLLQEAQTQIARSHDDCQRLTELLDKTRQKILTSVPSDTLLRFSADIQRLGEQRHVLRPYPDDLAKRRAEVQLLVSQINDHLAELGWPSLPPLEVKQKLPSALELEGFEQLLAQHEKLTLSVTTTQQALAKRKEEFADLMRARDASCDQGAPERLRHAVEEARRLGDVDARRLELSAPAELSKKRLLSAFAQLTPWHGDLSALRAMAPPSDEELELIAQRFERLQKDEEQAKNEQVNETSKLELLRLTEQQVTRDATPVTRQQLEICRGTRDGYWQSIRTQLQSPNDRAVTDLADVANYETACHSADELADKRFDAATASVTLQQTRAEIEQIELRIALVNRRLAEARAQRLALIQSLADLTPEQTLCFDYPAKLRRWLGLRRDVLLLGETAERDRLNVQQQERVVAAGEATLRSALVECGLLNGGNEPMGFTALLRLAANQVARLDEQRARQQTLLEQAQKLERSIPEQQAQFARAEANLGSWQQAYEDTLRRFGLATEMAPAVAKVALNLLREVSSKLTKVANIQRERIDTMTRDLERFAAAVQEVVSSAADDLANLNPFERIQGLLLRLREQEQVTAALSEARIEQERYLKAFAEADAKRTQAEAALQPLYALSQATGLLALSAAVECSNRKRELLRDCESEERALLESGDGLSLDALEAEALSVDCSLLESKLKEHQEQLAAFAHKRKVLDIAHTDAERALAAIAGHADAAAAATRRNEAIAGMTDAIERYLQLRTMSTLLKWAMERFRREKQGPLLSRSSELFSVLTLGQFSGLSVMADDNDRPQLLGVRPSGSVVTLSAMSTGTTDQLYLALRVAALELHLDNAPALPFVADDLFIHFDDERSAAAFSVLAKLSQRTQVLFFTHHEHLVQVARSALGDAVHISQL